MLMPLKLRIEAIWQGVARRLKWTPRQIAIFKDKCEESNVDRNKLARAAEEKKNATKTKTKG